MVLSATVGNLPFQARHYCAQTRIVPSSYISLGNGGPSKEFCHYTVSLNHRYGSLILRYSGSLTNFGHVRGAICKLAYSSPFGLFELGQWPAGTFHTASPDTLAGPAV